MLAARRRSTNSSSAEYETLTAQWEQEKRSAAASYSMGWPQCHAAPLRERVRPGGIVSASGIGYAAGGAAGAGCGGGIAAIAASCAWLPVAMLAAWT